MSDALYGKLARILAGRDVALMFAILECIPPLSSRRFVDQLDGLVSAPRTSRMSKELGRAAEDALGRLNVSLAANGNELLRCSSSENEVSKLLRASKASMRCDPAVLPRLHDPGNDALQSNGELTDGNAISERGNVASR